MSCDPCNSKQNLINYYSSKRLSFAFPTISTAMDKEQVTEHAMEIDGLDAREVVIDATDQVASAAEQVTEHAMEIHGFGRRLLPIKILDAREVVVDATATDQVASAAEQVMEHAMEIHGFDAREVVVDATDQFASAAELAMEIHGPAPGQKMMITAFAPDYGSTILPTKVMVCGVFSDDCGVFSDDCKEFNDDYLKMPTSDLDCICGDITVDAKFIQRGVYSCLIPPHPAGKVNLQLSFEGVPISEAVSFEFLEDELF